MAYASTFCKKWGHFSANKTFKVQRTHIWGGLPLPWMPGLGLPSSWRRPPSSWRRPPSPWRPGRRASSAKELLLAQFQVKLNVIDVLLTLEKKIIDKFYHSKCSFRAETKKYWEIAANIRTVRLRDATDETYAVFDGLHTVCFIRDTL